MTAQELKTGEPSLEWVDDFHIIVDAVDRKKFFVNSIPNQLLLVLLNVVL